MNLVQVQNQLRGLSDQQLQQAYMQNSGEVPPFLVLAESKRRADMRQAASQQQTAMQAQQPSVAEQIMAPPQQPQMAPQGAAPAQGAPMGQAGMPQMQAPPQGGIQAFRQGGQVRGFNSGGWLRKLSDYLAENDPVKRMLTGDAESVAPEPSWRDPNLDFAEEERKKKEAAARELDFAMERPGGPPAEAGIRAVRPAPVARPAAPASPVPTAAQPTPPAGIAALPATPEVQGPPSPSPLEALRNQAQMAMGNRPNRTAMYEEALKNAPEPGANLKAAIEQQRSVLDQRLQKAKDERLQNFFLSLASGQSQNALTNIGKALDDEAKNFAKSEAYVGAERDKLLFQLAEAQDKGNEQVFNRTLKKLETLALDNADEATLRRELLNIESQIATARTAAERNQLEARRLALEEAVKKSTVGLNEARTKSLNSGVGGKAPDKAAVAKRVADTAKIGYDKLPGPLRVELDRKGGNAAVEKLMLDAALEGTPIAYETAMKSVLGGGAGVPAGRGPKAISITEVK